MQHATKNRTAAKAIAKDGTITLVRRAFIGFMTAAVFLATILFGQNAFADNTDPAEQQKAREFIETFSDRAIDVLNNKDLTEEQSLAAYRNILNDAFAINYIARITLSRHRKKATKEELDAYYDLFPEFILKVNSTRLKKLDTTRLEVEQVTPHAKSDIFIRTKAFGSDNKPVDVDWRVRSDKNGTVKIIDVKVEGISLVATQRDDFTSRISSSGVSGLNKYMQDIINGVAFAEEEATS